MKILKYKQDESEKFFKNIHISFNVKKYIIN